MATVVRMPSVLAGATEAAIASWLVAPGDTVAVGTPIAEIETEKALVEYAAEEPGVIGRLVLAVGDTGEIGDPIAVLVADGESEADIEAALGRAPSGADAPSAPAPPPAPGPAPAPAPAATPPGLIEEAAAPGPFEEAAPPATSGADAATSPASVPPPIPASPVGPVTTTPAASPVSTTPVTTTPVTATPVSTAPPQSNGHPAAGDGTGARVFASPLVRKLAGEKGINVAGLTGTGPNGRVVRRDLERFIATPAAPPAGPQAPSAELEALPAGPQAPPAGPEALPAGSQAPGAGAKQRPVPPADSPRAAPVTGAAASAGTHLIPHTPMRRAIARRLTESKASTPHFYLTAECLVDDLLALRAQVNEASPVRVSVNDFVIMAAAAAFADVPEANVTWSDEGLVAHDGVDLSIAIATEGGLVTPVLRAVDGKRLSGIARETRDLAARARDKRLHVHELEGGTFSISNLGMYGTLEFSAIINPPQSGILAVGAAQPQPVVIDGAVAVATVMRCTLSVDHRAIDGALAARWLAAFTARLQHPLATLI